MCYLANSDHLLRVQRAIAVALVLACGLTVRPSVGQQASRVETQMVTASRAFPEIKTGRDLRKEAVLGKGDVIARVIVKEHIIAPPPGMVIDPYNNGEIQALAAESDVIAICKVITVSSALTADGGFVFSRYELAIETPFLDKLRGLAEDGLLRLVAPGGEIMINGHKIDASVSNVPRLIAGDSYLLYLKHDASVDSFRLVNLDILQVQQQSEDMKVSSPSVSPANQTLIRNKSKYLDALRANIASQLNRGKE